MQRKPFRRLKRTLYMSGALFGAAAIASADDAMMDKLMKENQDLKNRMEALEALAQKQGLLPSSTPPKFVSALSDITISGFVQASYFYNTQRPVDHKSDGYLWNTTDNSFSLNKVKLTLASAPVERTGEKWEAGFRTSFIWGEDS